MQPRCLTVCNKAKYGKGRRKGFTQFFIALLMISPSHIKKYFNLWRDTMNEFIRIKLPSMLERNI